MNITHLKPFLLLLILLTSGCASINGPADPRDPLESYNRTMFEFNDTVDQYFLKPVAQGYQAITPDPIMKGINNFFSNLDDIIVIFNDLLQLKPMRFASDLGRFIVNSTLGLGGFIDWASDMNMPKHEENFGQTLGYWGVPEGPYFVIPFFGPSTIRDSVGRLVDGSQTDPVWVTIEDGYPLEERELSLSLSVTYLQRSLNLVYDGDPPEEEAEFSENELFDFDETDEPLEKPNEKVQ